MGTGLRRGIFFSLLALLACALSWHPILSFCVREAAFWKLGCSLSYRELRIEDWAIVLKDVRLFAHSSYELFADKISIDFRRTKPVAIRLSRPHLILPKCISADFFHGQGKRRQISLAAEDGTFEILGAHPFSGRFSFLDQRLILEGADGSMTLSCLDFAEEKKIECSFENWPLAPFIDLLHSPEISPLSGTLSGFLHFSRDKIIGRIRLEDAGWISSKWQAAGGVEKLDWEGEIDSGVASIFSDGFDISRFQRMKIRLQGSCAVRGSSRIDSLCGLFFFNQGVGIRWEFEGNSFAWNGKSFFRKEDSQWMQSCLDFSGSFASIGMEMESGDRYWTLALDRAGADFFQLLSDFWPEIDWPCQLKNGELSAQFSCKEREGELHEWRVSSFEGRDLELRSSDGEFFAGYVSASAACKENDRAQFYGELNLNKGRFSDERFFATDLGATVRIENGEITSGNAVAGINGLDVEAIFSGSLHESLSDLRIRGSWERFGEFAGLKTKLNGGGEFVEATLLLKGDWNVFLATFNLPFAAGGEIGGRAAVDHGKIFEAGIEARHFDLVRLEPFCDFECGGIADLKMHYADEKWTVELHGEDLALKSKEASLWIPELNILGASEKNRWTACAEKVNGEVSFLGEAIPFTGLLVWDDGLLSAQIDEGSFAGIDFEGQWLCALEEGIPFSFEAKKLHGRLDELASLFGLDVSGKIDCRNCFCMDGSFLSDPQSWRWSTSLTLSEFCYGALQNVQALISANSETGLLECAHLQGKLDVGAASFPFRGSSAYRDGSWLFELRLEDRFRDLARIHGSAYKDLSGICFAIDPVKSHFLGSPIHVQEFRTSGHDLDALNLSTKLSCKALRSLQSSLEKIDRRFSSLREMPLEGSNSIEIDLRSNAPSTVRVQGENLLWRGQNIPFHLVLLQNRGKWKIESMQIGEYAGRASISKEGERWKVESGEVLYKNGAEASVSGFLGPALQCKLTVESLLIDLKKTGLEEISSFEGKVMGSGYVSMGWKDDLLFEVDLDLCPTSIKCGELFVENSTPLQLHFSKQHGVLIRGLDLQVQKPDCDSSWLYGRIELMQYDFPKSRWLLHHSHLRLPIGSFSLLLKKIGKHHPVALFLESLDPKNDFECSAEISFSDDLTSISCFMKEGFVPFLGAVRHLQNVDLQYSDGEASVDFLALHQGHSLKIGARVDLDRLSGTLILEDEESPPGIDERPMVLHWELHPEKGFLLHSIEGSFGGVDASFHEEVRADGSGLIGTAKIDFASFSELLPQRIGKIFNELKMGKGYELKGRLFYGHDWSDPVFKGLLSGKNCELFGWQIRSFLSQIEAGPSFVHLFEVKGSDSAGIMKINELTMNRREEEPWKISMPVFKLQEFRPSLLQKVGRDVGPIGPLVVRDLKLTDFQGDLEESLTYTGKGELSFINSFKREHTVFDIPADVLGRIFGLDLELLIPVKGNLTFELKEGKFFLDELSDAYSEGKRSKFFLVKEGSSPFVDLDGNVNILVKMKQYVLFKFTENFLLSIDGTLDTPSYSLQKKSRIQKL